MNEVIDLHNFIGLDVPERVAICPYCEKPLHVDAITEWEYDDSMQIIRVLEIELDCTNPDKSGHWEMPYIYWMPVDETVTRWINKEFSLY